jgi:hypothetical protein
LGGQGIGLAHDGGKGGSGAKKIRIVTVFIASGDLAAVKVENDLRLKTEPKLGMTLCSHRSSASCARLMWLSALFIAQLEDIDGFFFGSSMNNPGYPAEDYHQDFHIKNPTRYQLYRVACGRDRRLKEIWGDGRPNGKEQAR